MRKFILFALLFCWATLSNAQKLGNYELDVAGTYSETSQVYERWLNDDGIYTMKFRLNPMGFKHAMEEVRRILADNSMADAEPAFDKSTQASDITDDEDPEQWHKSIMKGNSEVRIGFMFPGSKLLQVFMDQESYQLNLLGVNR